MKTIYILLFFTAALFQSAESQTISGTFDHEGYTREYLIHLPVNYNGSTPLPVLFAFHGLGDNMSNFGNGTGFFYVGDTANFITVVPQAIDLGQGTSWNAGAYLNTAINDVGFIRELIDTLSQSYAIDTNRLYAMGFSMGGMFSHRLACELSDKICAIAAISGPIASQVGPTCSPGFPVAVMHMHGTSDGTVPYTGSFYNWSVDATIDFWVNHNNADTAAEYAYLPDVANDGYNVETYNHPNGENNTRILLYKENNADHVWLGPSNDVNSTVEVWNFLRQHSRTGSVGVAENKPENAIKRMSNAHNSVVLEFEEITNAEIAIHDMFGKVVVQKHHNSGTVCTLNTSVLSTGIYVIAVKTKTKTNTIRFFKNQ